MIIEKLSLAISSYLIWQVAEVLATFLVRHKVAEPAANFTRYELLQ